MLGRYPVNGALDLAAVHRHAVAGLKISRAADFHDLAIVILDDLVALDDIRAHQSNLAVRLETLELRRRHLSEIALFDIQLTGERNLAAACFLIARIVRHFELLALTLRIVGDNQLDRLGDCHAAQRGLVQLLADTVLEQLDVNQRVGLCDTSALYEIEDGARRVAAAAQRTQRRHTRIIPTLNVLFKYQLAQVTLGHNGVRYVQAGKLALLGMMRQRAVVNHPLVQRTVVLKLNRAHGVRDALKCVLNRVCKVVQRIDAPLIALPVMVCTHDAVNRRVAQVHVRTCHVDLGTQRLGAIGKLAVAHVLEQLQVFLNRTVAVRTRLARLGQRAAVLAHFLLRQIVNICLAVLDQLYRAVKAGFKVVRAVVHTAARLLTGQPLDVLPDGVYILGILLDRVGVVIAQIEQAVVFFCNRPVDEDRLCRANVQITVRLRRKAGVDALGKTVRNVLINNFGQKVIYIF